MNQWRDKDFVINAVREDGNALEKASAILKADLDIVLEAVKTDNTAIKHADPYIQGMFGYKNGDEPQSTNKLLKNLEVKMAMRSVLLANTCFGHNVKQGSLRI